MNGMRGAPTHTHEKSSRGRIPGIGLVMNGMRGASTHTHEESSRGNSANQGRIPGIGLVMTAKPANLAEKWLACMLHGLHAMPGIVLCRTPCRETAFRAHHAWNRALMHTNA
jgi:hypothetical protein